MAAHPSIKDALIVTGATNNITMLLRDVLRRHGFTIASQKTSLSDARESISQGLGQLIVIDDTPELPASFALRSLFADPICCLTPTIVLVSESITGKDFSVESIGNPAILKKPLTPEQFGPMLKELRRRWLRPEYLQILEARKKLIQGNTESGLRTLIELCSTKGAQELAAPAVAWYYRKSKNLRTAEKLLLGVLKNHPTDAGIILALSDLYLHSAMPSVAKRLLVKAKKIFAGETIALDLELVQANLLLGNLREIIPVIDQLVENAIMAKELMPLLLKVVYSEGIYDKSRKYSGKKLSDLQTIEAAWNPKVSKSALTVKAS